MTFSTTMTLFLMPVLYYIFNRYREKRAVKKELRRQKRAEKKAIKIAAEAQMRAEKQAAKAKKEELAEGLYDQPNEDLSTEKTYGMEDFDE